MKKLVWLVILLFLFAGCSKQAAAAAKTPVLDNKNPKGYMEEPQILVSCMHQYNDESWLDEQAKFIDDAFESNGDGISLDIIFQGEIDENRLKEAVMLENYSGSPEISFFKDKDKTILYANYRDLEHNKKYNLIISDKLENKEGKTLKAAIRKEISLKPDTTVKYTIIGTEGVYPASGRHTIIDSYAVGSMNLSSEEKTVAVDFSSEADVKSVEQSVYNSLQGRGLKYSFEWKDPQSLLIKLDGFKNGEDSPYCISMASAKDITGNPIYGDLYFLADKANWLGSINLKGKSDYALYKFQDKRYMAVQSSNIDGSIILDDTETKYIFNINTKKTEKLGLDSEYTLGMPEFRFAHSWIGGNEILLLSRATGQLLSYSVLDGSSKELFKLPTDMLSGNLMGMSISPDGSKIAIAYEEGSSYINVFSMNGKQLYKAENIYKPREVEALGSVYSLQWLDNSMIVLEDNVSTETKPDYNVIGINIETGKKALIAEHAYKPITMADKNLIKVEHFKDFASGNGTVEIMRSGNVVGSFGTKLNEYRNFFYADANTLVFNHGDEIVIYSIDTGKPETLGNGYIIGLSQDKSSLYYMTSYKMLYYID